jgi:hypothetical protein
MNNEELVKNHSAELIQNLVTEVIAKEKIEIRFEFEENEQWSVVTTFVDEEDKEISLRLHVNDLFNLYVGYYNDDDEFLEIIQPLTAEEKKMIPKGLRKIMEKVLADEQGMRVPGNLLSK